MSESRDLQPARPPKVASANEAPRPAEAPRSWSTWIMVTVVACLCGGVLALALGGGRHASSQPVEVAREVPIDAPRGSSADRRAEERPTEGGPITLAAASESISIEMYSATWCSACARARTWLGQQGVTYHEIDVDTRADAMGQLSMLNPRRTLPTFDIDGDVVVGFDSSRLSTTIEGAARRRR